jgi:hypothetical protein
MLEESKKDASLAQLEEMAKDLGYSRTCDAVSNMRAALIDQNHRLFEITSAEKKREVGLRAARQLGLGRSRNNKTLHLR